ncbi:MAG TPA: metal-binding protein [Candidatus Obscuribacterales bacterium]
MPSGKTHDRITLWCLPWVGLGALAVTSHWGYTLLVTTSFTFAGLMFGPDLDIRSVQSKRWGWLGWLWSPYRRHLRHRSWLSHGFLAGTVGRLLYLFIWIVIGILGVLEFTNRSGQTSVTWQGLGQAIAQIFFQYWRVWAAIAVGIELGAMSHSVSDWLVSGWRRRQRQQRPSGTKSRPRRRRR